MPTKTKTTKSTTAKRPVTRKKVAASTAAKVSTKRISKSGARAAGESVLLTRDLVVAWLVLIIVFLAFVIKVYGL